MKILQIYEQGPLKGGIVTGGVENHILNLSKELVKLGYEVSWITGAVPGLEKLETVDGVKVIRLEFFRLVSKSWNKDSLTLLRQILFFITCIVNIKQFKNYDIYIGHIYSSGLISYLMSKIFGRANVNVIHGSYLGIWKEIKGRILGAIYRTLEFPLLRLLAKISDVQVHMEPSIPKCLVNTGVNGEKLRIFSNGINLSQFKPPDTYKKGLVMSCRRLVKKNGLHILIKAMRKINGKLLIFGDGPEMKKLKDLVEKLSLNSKVEFKGWIPNSKIPNAMKMAHVIVVPSLSEASSIGVLEGMAMGKPVVASRLPGIEMLGEDGKHFILFKRGDINQLVEKVNLLIENPELSLRIGREARIQAQKFSWNNQAKVFNRILKDVLVKNLKYKRHINT